MQKHTDTTELQNEVIDSWENQGIVYFDRSLNGFIENPVMETDVKPAFRWILADPESCVKELGFDSISQYIASKGE